MKRYEITSQLRKTLLNNHLSLSKLSDLLEFNIKHIIYENKTINEIQLKKLESFLDISFKLNEIKLNPTGNLGEYAQTQPVKKIRKGKDLAEFIGIMLGDGNIFRNAITVTLDKRNSLYKDHVKNLFEDLFGIKFREKIHKGRNTLYLYCYNQILTEKLIHFGLKRGNKIKNKIEIPQWIKESKNYSKSCIRGLIDTDGCIYFSKRDKQKYIKFTNFNQILLKDFREMTKNLGYNFAKANKNNSCLYRKKEVARFINEIKPLKSI